MHGAITEILESEAWGDYVNPASFLYDDPNFGYPIAPISLVGDRHDGGERRLIETETHLAAIRGQARVLYWSTPYGINAVTNLQNYTIGQGFEYKAEEVPDCGVEVPQDLVRAVNREIQRFLDVNNWCGSNEAEGEILMRSSRDGEAFVSLSVDRSKRICARIIDPECVVQPSSERELEEWLYSRGMVSCDMPLSWSFGVVTPEDDVTTKLALHVQWSQSAADCDIVPASHFEHLKKNTDSTVKRGVSDFFPILNDLTREAKLRKNTADGAALQAAIAYVQEMPQGTPSAQAAALVKPTSTYQQPVAGGGTRTVNKQQFNSGTIIRMPSGQRFIPGPMGSERIPAFMEIAAYVLRAIGNRWAMPEYMISGDASNANYASTMVAESPFTKAREADQRFYAGRFRNLIWKMLRIAYQIGRFDRFGATWDQIQDMVEVHVTCPEVASRNKAENATVAQLQIASGILSKRTAAAQAGLNYDDEQRNISEEGGHVAPAGATIDPNAGTDTGDVAATALNGAQITSLNGLIASVASGQMPVETARAIIAASFPILTSQQIDDMLKPLIGFTPAAVDDKGLPVQTDATGPVGQPAMSGKFAEMGRRQTKNHDATTMAILKAVADKSMPETMAKIKLKGLLYDPTEVDALIAEAKGGPVADAEPGDAPTVESAVDLSWAEIREQIRKRRAMENYP